MRVPWLALASVAVLVVCFACPAAVAGMWDEMIVDHESNVSSSELQQEYGLRSIALSPDDNYVFGGWLHGNGISYLYKYDAHQTATPDRGDLNPPRYYIARIQTPQSNVQWRAVAATPSWVYAGLGKKDASGSGDYGFAVLQADLSAITTTRTLSLPVNGITTFGNYLYLSETSSTSAPVQRYLLTDPANPTLDPLWGSGGTLDIPGAGDLRGMTTDSSGNLYIVSGGGGTPGKVYRIDAATQAATATTFNIGKGMDVALYHNTLYVTEYNAIDSKIRMISLSLADGGYLPNTPAHSYNGLWDGVNPGRNFPGGGYSGIDITNTGRILLADQYWNDTGEPGTPQEFLRDRLYESAPIPEPGTIALFGLGVPVLIGALRRKRRAA